jgi:ribosomal protein S6--L-glutamate ligase
MNIAILSRGPQLYSTQSLYRAGLRRGHYMHIIDHTRCTLVVDRGAPQVYYDDFRLNSIDAVIPRIGASVTSQGAAVINQFEMMNAFTVARAEALLQSRDKLRCLQKLSRCGIDTPRTVFAAPGQNLSHLINLVGGLPIVIKLLESTHGIGVLLAESYHSAESAVEAFQKLGGRVLLQEFIAEAQGADIRAFVVAGEIVATMKRQAQEGEFRSNLHRGASSTAIHLNEHEQQLVKKTVRMMGLDVAGVDILPSNRGPLIIEVNASPGLEGIETTTQVDIAGKIIDFVEKRVLELRNYRNHAEKKLRR